MNSGSVKKSVTIDADLEKANAEIAEADAEIAKQNNEKHLFALESDVGGFSPRGFSFEADNDQLKKINSWQNYHVVMHTYFIHR